MEAYVTHSGYAIDLPYDFAGFGFPDGAVFHDFHHSFNRGNFASPLMDWMFGTMDAFLALGGADGYRNLGLVDSYNGHDE
jgi:sterol desaturase/sphingolipid hydroxylase (fatty acid hydroxylase superfamily)